MYDLPEMLSRLKVLIERDKKDGAIHLLDRIIAFVKEDDDDQGRTA